MVRVCDLKGWPRVRFGGQPRPPRLFYHVGRGIRASVQLMPMTLYREDAVRVRVALAWVLASGLAAAGCGDAQVAAVGDNGKRAQETVAVTAAPTTAAGDHAAPVESPSVTWDDAERLPAVPAWIADAVFYQIF